MYYMISAMSSHNPFLCEPTRVASILVPGVFGQPYIELANAYVINQDDPVSRNYHRHKFIKLPPEVYPPTWESRNDVEQTIIAAALAQSQTELVRAKQDKSSSYSRLSTEGITRKKMELTFLMMRSITVCLQHSLCTRLT